MTHQFDYRYVLPGIPLLTTAAAFGVAVLLQSRRPGPAGRDAARPGPSEARSEDPNVGDGRLR
jgi:hypothetical protein